MPKPKLRPGALARTGIILSSLLCWRPLLRRVQHA